MAERLDDFVLTVNRAVCRHGLAMAIDVGRLVLDCFFDGDPELFRSPRWKQRASFRTLVRHPGLEISASALHAYVAISIQLRELPGPLAAELSLTRHRYLLPIADLRVKAELARRSIDEEWSAERLRREVSDARPPGSRPGRPRTPVVVKIVNEVERAVRPERIEALEGAGSQSAEDAAALIERLEQVEASIRSLRERLQRRVDITRPEGSG